MVSKFDSQPPDQLIELYPEPPYEVIEWTKQDSTFEAVSSLFDNEEIICEYAVRNWDDVGKRILQCLVFYVYTDRS